MPLTAKTTEPPIITRIAPASEDDEAGNGDKDTQKLDRRKRRLAGDERRQKQRRDRDGGAEDGGEAGIDRSFRLGCGEEGQGDGAERHR
jgi:hypothetical protein